MATKIEWCDETWNPVIGCSKISEGCDNCYAEIMANRLKKMLHETNTFASRAYDDVTTGEGKWNGLTRFVNSSLVKPLHWKRPRKIFVCSMGDLFHESVLWIWIERILGIIEKTPRHTYMILTKRPLNMLEFFEDRGKVPDNLWLGVSVEKQKYVERVKYLVQIDAKVRFVSLEPLLSDVELYPWLEGLVGPSESMLGDWVRGVNWVILGGESGSKARPMHPDWVNGIRIKCKANNIPFFFKQWGGYMPIDAANAMEKDEIVLEPDGRQMIISTHRDAMVMKKVGKKDAGCLIDGVEYKEFPKV